MTDWTEDDIGDQSGRIALITGANSGIGFEAARALAEHGAHVVLACRNPDKAERARAAIEARDPAGSVEVLVMDLGDLDSVASAAERFVRTHGRLDVLVNNAGLMAPPRGTTAQGFESQFGVNHLGHFALTAAVLPALLATDGSRVVTISSGAHKVGRMDFDDLQGRTSYKPWRAYAQSKLANLLFTRELQRRFASSGAPTIAVAAHPGGSATNLGKESAGGVVNNLIQRARPTFEKYMMQSPAMGALPTLRAAVDPGVSGGEYYGPDGLGEQRGHPELVKMTRRARNEADARRLWAVSVELTGADYSALG